MRLCLGAAHGRIPAVGLAVAIALLVSVAVAGSGPVIASERADEEQVLVARLNALRATRGLPALAVDLQLTTVARGWAARMAAAGAPSHHPDLAREVRPGWVRVGQNVGAGATAAAVHEQLAGSPEHLANMVSPSFNNVGIGVAVAGGRLWVTQVFVEGPPVRAAGTGAESTGPAPPPVAAQPAVGAPTAPLVPAPGPQSERAPGYRLVGAGGDTYAFGAATNLGGPSPSSPVVAGAGTPTGEGVWLASTDGAVAARGDAGFFGSMAGKGLAQPIVGMTATPTGKGYWLVARDGGIFSFGDARFFGSTGAIKLNQPIVGMAASPTGAGYWFVAADGGIFAFGDARFAGSTGAVKLNQPVVGMASTKAGRGYWLVARDGGIFSFGDAKFFGSTGAIRLNQPIVGMARSSSGNGYRFVAADGGIFSFGDAAFLGSTGGRPLASPVTAVVATA